jgi:hypothetical protein
MNFDGGFDETTNEKNFHELADEANADVALAGEEEPKNEDFVAVVGMKILALQPEDDKLYSQL